MRATQRNHCLIYTLVLDHLARKRFHAKELLVGSKRSVEITDCDPNMVDVHKLHQIECTAGQYYGSETTEEC